MKKAKLKRHPHQSHRSPQEEHALRSHDEHAFHLARIKHLEEQNAQLHFENKQLKEGRPIEWVNWLSVQSLARQLVTQIQEAVEISAPQEQKES